MFRVLGGIYISSIKPINDGEDLKEKHKISNILSILTGPIPEIYQKEYNFKQFEITDEETTNIIDIFEKTNAFIDSALFPPTEEVIEVKDRKRHRGSVLVHCAQGSSRSATIIAAYLMYKYNLSAENALRAIKRKCDYADPIENFKDQLNLYEAFDHKLDKSNELYKQLNLKLKFTVDPSGHAIREYEFREDTPDVMKKSTSELRCKRCRQVLALSSSFIPHTPPDSDSSQSQFIKRAPNSRRIISVQEGSDTCSHFFVEPLKWMQEELQGKGEIEGKFCCPKCEAKIGAYSWKGTRCSCGKWMIPAIHLQTAKVDEMKKVNSNILAINHT